MSRGPARDATRVRLEAALAAGQLLAARLLAEDAAATETDRVGESWDLSGYRTGLEGGLTLGPTLGLALGDLQGRFNLNLLLRREAAPAEAVFQRLAEGAGVPPDAVAAILSHYRSLRPAANEAPAPRAEGPTLANDALALPEEVAAIPGVGAEAARALAPLVSTLPEAAGVNLGTAAPEVMAAIVGVSDPAAYDSFDARRRAAPFETVAEALGAVAEAWGEPAAAAGQNEDALSITSDWFEAHVTVAAEGADLAARLVFYRSAEDGSVRLAARIPEDP